VPSVVNNTILKEVKEEFEANPYAFLSSFHGVPVETMATLRRNLEKHSNRSLVVKHSLAKKALEAMKIEGADSLFKDHLLVTLGDKDPQQISKALIEFAKTNSKFKPCGVVFEKKLYDSAFVKSLSQLPSRHELLTQVVVRVKSPISGFVLTLSQMLRGIAVALNEIRKQKEGGSAATA
jgi:large subunit ribosomal protein L10